VCVRPRHKNVDILEIFDHESVKEDDTYMVDVGDVFRGQRLGILLRFSYGCTPGRKDLLEVHMSHYDGNGERHLTTVVLNGNFVMDESETMASLPASHVVDKVMKV
jgi:hypothetical protein